MDGKQPSHDVQDTGHAGAAFASPRNRFMIRRNRRQLFHSVLALGLGGWLFGTGCSNGGADSKPSPTADRAALVPAAEPPKDAGRLVVFAASSLKDAFTALSKEFELSLIHI